MKKLALGLLLVASLALPGVGLAQSNVITIGFTASLTGKLNADSKPQLRGFKLWANHVNANGGISVGGEQYKVELQFYNDQSSAGRVQQLYTRLILQDSADFLFSPYSSGLTATASVVSEQFGTIMLTTGAAEGKTYKLGNRYLFQIYTPAGQYLVSPLRLIKAHDPDAKIALVYSNDGFSKAAAMGAVKAAKKLGLNIVLKQAYAPSTTNFGPIINKIVASGADVLIGGGHYADGSTLARQLYANNVDLKMIALLVAPANPRFASLGKAAFGVLVPAQWAPAVTYEPDFGPTAQEFVKMFKQKYGNAPGYHAAGGYVAGLVLQHAIEKADSLETKVVAKVLNNMNAMTFFGRIQFADKKARHGLQMGHEMVLIQWQRGNDGELTKELVYPKSARTAPVLYPLKKFD